MSAKQKIIEHLEGWQAKPVGMDELQKQLEIPKKERRELEDAIDQLIADGSLVRTSKGKLALPEWLNMLAGRLQATARGFAFLIPDRQGVADVFIAADDLNGAMNGDRVMVRFKPRHRADERVSGEVAAVLERVNKRIVGTYEEIGGKGYLRPDQRRLPLEIRIAKGMDNGARPGDKVVAKIIKWPEGLQGAVAKVGEVLGASDAPGSDILSVIRQYDLPDEFPDDVLEEARAAAVPPGESERRGRLDLRDKIVFTIDGADAKDLDDAVSLEKLPNGNCLLGVHIADVSHYVKAGGKLDKHAKKRGTSVYFPDRVLPMLPPELSNGVCSLSAGEDKLAFSVQMEVDPRGQVLLSRFDKSVIKSVFRMTYDDVNAILEGDEALCRRYEKILPTIALMRELMDTLRARRRKRGSIDFDLPEAYIHLDESGAPVSIERAKRGDAHRMIEEFMLLSNETVAEYMERTGGPCVYRVHEVPDAEKVREFSEIASLLGYTLRTGREGKVFPKAYQQLLDQLDGQREEGMLSRLALRSLKRARYAASDLGHFGLAAQHYCHFTSPIRRYPDLMVHRGLMAVLSGRYVDARTAKEHRRLDEIAAGCSVCERQAAEAEMDVDAIKKAQYMAQRIGQTFAGVVSGVTAYGLYVELENTVEGMIHISRLQDDYYEFDPLRYRLVGERRKRAYSLGDPIAVRVLGADAALRTVDFELADERV